MVERGSHLVSCHSVLKDEMMVEKPVFLLHVSHCFSSLKTKQKQINKIMKEVEEMTLEGKE
jgi:SUMO ligase MMS21 Smc5/6 complex component